MNSRRATALIWVLSAVIALTGTVFLVLILLLAFASMASAPDTDTKIAATGLAAGILLDATVIRALIVPALVMVLGRWNWWLPSWPSRLLRVEPSLPPRPPAEATVSAVDGV